MAPEKELEAQQDAVAGTTRYGEVKLETGEVVNASGHRQELERNFSLFNMCAVAVVIGNCWAISGATINLSIFNGGAPGVIYEFIVVGVFYLCITVNLAELASAIPSSAGVYHWASVTPGRRAGRALGFFAGYWNAFAYALGAASLAATAGSAVLEMWSLTHPGYAFARWHVLVIYLALIWGATAVLLFANRALPAVNNAFMALGLLGWLVCVVAVAALPSRGRVVDDDGSSSSSTASGYASSSFVWKEWQNNTGYVSNGLVFVLGMFNGAFNIGTPDCSSHMAEEVPRPSINIPIAMGTQMTASFLSTIVYYVVLMYGITDFDSVLNTTAAFPLTKIYHQVAGASAPGVSPAAAAAGAIGLTIVTLLPLVGSQMGAMLTASRVFWTLARDGATPCAGALARVDPRWKNPFNAIVLVAVFCTVMGLVYLGSDAAFAAMVGSFALLTTLSYLAALVPFALRGRARRLRPGPFFVRGAPGYALNAVSCGFLLVWLVFYCFPYSLPVAAADMNYSSAIVGGLTLLVAVWWCCVQGRYEGPPVIVMSGEM
ncbi:putative choline transport protein [Biscogniauxia mediterranea]|nr:putative choline transport protein [Biscogniauxia mediterranea]